jgi:signal transduction histidine kinase
VSGPLAWWNWWRTSPLRNVVFTLGILALTLVGSVAEAHPNSQMASVLKGHHLPHEPAAAFVIVALAALALFWRQRRPVAVLAVTTAAVAVYSLLGFENGTALLVPMVALYAVAASQPVAHSIAYAIATVVVLMAATAANNPLGPTGGGLVVIPGLVAAALFLGIAVANRQALISSLRARTEEEAVRRVDEERLRIARELHDVVAHTMATINVQAGVAAHVLSTNPEAAAEALQAIKGASKDGLRELRAILNVLRQADEDDPTQPTPGLDQLEPLLAGIRRAGLETTLAVHGEPRTLGTAIDLAAYRIIQESLTNSLRHAGRASASVSLTYRPNELVVEVTDDGLGPPTTRAGNGGHGLIGMRERATTVGGTLDAGPGDDRGFRVRATLPLDPTQGPGPQPASTGAPT